MKSVHLELEQYLRKNLQTAPATKCYLLKRSFCSAGLSAISNILISPDR